jgi:propionyl-CoA synthetase
VGVHDTLKGQMPQTFTVLRDPSILKDPEKKAALEKEVIAKAKKNQI